LASTGEGTCPRSPFQQLEVRSTQFPDTLAQSRGRGIQKKGQWHTIR
jgi:hypothetical protein